MQALQEQLQNVTKTLQTLSHTDLSTMDDAKQLKSVLFVVDRVLKVLGTEVQQLELLKLRGMERLNSKTAALKADLEKAEQKFLIKYAVKPQEQKSTCPTIDVDIGSGIQYMCPLYSTREEIPIMSYGAILQHGSPLVLFRYSAKDFVSVTACHVMDFNGPNDNHRTVCCGNLNECEFGDTCRYFHDPAIWPESDHIQRFTRTSMVKKCPYFGHATLFAEQARTLGFESLRTLARYCAVMNLLIFLVAQKNPSK